MLNDDYKRVASSAEAAHENSSQAAKSATVHGQWLNPAYGNTGASMCGIDTLDLSTLMKHRVVSCAACLAALRKERQRRSREGTANYQARRNSAEIERDALERGQQVLMERDAACLRKLREICGWVENSSGEGVTIGQDDATRDWFLSVGYDGISGKRRSYTATGFESVIDAAYEKEQGKDR